MDTVLVGLTLIAVTSLLMLLVTHAATHRVLARRILHGGSLPPISILKPLKGLDDGLAENLASFARLDYPAFEILLGVPSRADPAYAAACEVQRRYAHVAIRVVVCDRKLGRNPKVAVAAALAEVAQHDAVLISDSNVRVRPDYLKDIGAELADPRVGLVSNPIAGAGERTIGSLLENLQLASFVLSSVCAADALASHACVVGKSMLFRLSDLSRLGGFRAVRHVLAEDYVLGQKFQRAGFKVVLSPHAIQTVNEGWRLSHFVERHLRWAQMRRRLNAAAYFGEPLLNPTPWLLATLALTSGKPAALALIGLCVKAASDVLLLAKVRGAAIPAWKLPCIWLKDLLVLGIWAVGLFRQTLSWRGNHLRVARGSLLLPPPRPQLGAQPALARAA